MRRINFLTIFMSLAMLAQADASVKWLGKVHDFGAFDEDTKAKTAWFRFVNTGDEDVAIVSATATCGCTVPKYSTDPIAPGDTAVIEVSYDPSGRPGRFDKQIYVRTSASNERERLSIRGTVIGNAESVKARYPISAGALKLRNGAAMMGRVYKGHGKMQYVDGYNQSADSLHPVVKNVPEYVEVSVVPEVVGPGEMCTFNFYFRGDKCDNWGIVTDSVSLAPNPGAEAVSFPIVAIVEEDFSTLTPEQMASAPHISVADERVVLPPIPINSKQEVEKRVKISNVGTGPLLIRRVYSEDRGMSVSVSQDSIKKGKSADLIVKYNPSVQPTGIVNGKLVIITNDPYNPMVTLRIVGERE